MHAITIHQPWAWLIIHHPQIALPGQPVKRVENRPWRTRYRGPLAIHASKRVDPEGFALTKALGIELPDEYGYPGADGAGDDLPAAPIDHRRVLVMGCVIGTVELVDCRTRADWLHLARPHEDPFAFGPWCHVYRNPEALAAPVPARGQQRLWHLELPQVAAI